MRKTFKYRLSPNKQQQRLLEQQLEECRWLYSALPSERRVACEQGQASVRLYDQQATLPALKAAHPTLAEVRSQVVQNVAVRIDLAFQAVFCRVKGGENPGYPRFWGKGRYDSLTDPQVPSGCQLDADAPRLRLHRVRSVKISRPRPAEGTPKTATITRSSAGRWYVGFSCACAEPPPLPAAGQQVGIDVGLKTFATLSTGQEIANPRCFLRETALRLGQRRLSKEAQGTPEGTPEGMRAAHGGRPRA